jgi:hypothetical protein
VLFSTHCFGGLQRGLQTGGRAQTPLSLQNFGGRQLAGVHLFVLLALWTVNFSETFTSPALITSIRTPAEALEERLKVTVALAGVAVPICRFETPDDGLMLICDDVTLERSKKPDELMVSVGEVPAVTVLGVSGSACDSVVTKIRRAVATMATSD